MGVNMSAKTRSIIVGLAGVAVGLTLWRRRAQHARLSPAAPPLDLAVLACPGCHGHLALAGTSEAGTLTCGTCGRQYPIVAGIPHFIEAAMLTGLNRRCAYAYDWFSWVYRLFCRVAFAYIGMPEGAARREVLDRLEPCGGRVLEVSIGPGVNLPYLIGRPDVGEVHGLDISQGQLRRCQSYLQRQGWTVPLYLGNGEELPFGDDTFDSVFHIGGINFFNDKAKAIAEMVRVAKPGTRIVLCDENERGVRGYGKALPGLTGSADNMRRAVAPPVDALPPGMREVRVFDVWKGWAYCLEFSKPPA
jgi:ubiquinone/menaquinone biosynthesis C-methylase UbiE/uncharacterized protein YbaR (Trm112 family)